MQTINATTPETFELTKTLMQQKLENLLSNNLSTTQALTQIQRDSDLLDDRLIQPSAIIKGGHKLFTGGDQFAMDLEGEQFTFHNNAIGQLSERMGVPTKYAKNLIKEDWGRDLLSTIFQEHGERKTDKMLFRSVDNQFRGVLSNSYRRLDSMKIYENFIHRSAENGAVIYNASYNDVQTWIEVVIPEVFEIKTANNGSIFTVFGARIRNSDFGRSTCELRFFQMNVVCTNGMVGEQAVKEIHLGRKYDSIHYSNKTYELDTRTVSSAINDIVGGVLSSESIAKQAEKMKESTEEVIDTKQAVKRLTAAKIATKEEATEIEEAMLLSDPQEGIQGRPTRWKLTQAMTSVAKSKSTERRKQLEEMAGKMIFS